MGKIRLTEERRELYEMLMEVGSCYKSDASLYLGYLFGDRSRGSRLINYAEKNGLVSYRFINGGRCKRDYAVVTLSYQGKWHAIRKELYNSEEDTMDRIEMSDKDFDTHDLDDLNKQLMANRVKLAFEAVGIPAFPLHKPSLRMLFETLASRHIRVYENKTKYRFLRDEGNYLSMTYEECRDIIESGVYYSIAEVRSFLEDVNQNTLEKTFGSKAIGVFISLNRIAVVFAAPRGDNKNIFIRSSAEDSLLSELEVLFEITNVYRQLPTMIDRGYENGTEHKSPAPVNRFDAFVIGDSDDLVSKLVRKIKTKSGEDVTTNWLTGQPSLFERVYEIPFTTIGLDSLAYLTSHSIENWQEEMLEYFENNPHFSVNCNFALYPALHKMGNELATYMPVYECNQIEKVRSENFPVVFVTYPDMVKTISKATARKDILFYDITTGEDITSMVKLRYGLDGSPAGLSKVKAKLAEEDKDVKISELKTVAENADMDYHELCDKIDTGEIPVEEIVPQIETVPLKKRTKHFTENVSVLMNKEMKRNLEKAARYYNCSVPAYIRMFIKDQAKKDADAYDAALKEDRATRKKLAEDAGAKKGRDINDLIQSVEQK